MIRDNGVDSTAWSVSGAAISGVDVRSIAGSPGPDGVLSEPGSPWSNEALCDDGGVTGSQYAESGD